MTLSIYLAFPKIFLPFLITCCSRLIYIIMYFLFWKAVWLTLKLTYVYPCGSQLKPILYVVGLTAWFPLYRTCVHKVHFEEGICSSSENNMSLDPYCNVDTQLSALWKVTSVAENLVGMCYGFLPQQYTSYGDTHLWSHLGSRGRMIIKTLSISPLKTQTLSS